MGVGEKEKKKKYMAQAAWHAPKEIAPIQSVRSKENDEKDIVLLVTEILFFPAPPILDSVSCDFCCSERENS